MGEQLTREERETIVRFDEAEGPATVYTYNNALIKKLRQLSEKFPSDARLWREDGHGGVTYLIPKAWIAVRAPRILTEEQKEALRERATWVLRRKSTVITRENDTSSKEADTYDV